VSDHDIGSDLLVGDKGKANGKQPLVVIGLGPSMIANVTDGDGRPIDVTVTKETAE